MAKKTPGAAAAAKARTPKSGLGASGPKAAKVKGGGKMSKPGGGKSSMKGGY